MTKLRIPLSTPALGPNPMSEEELRQAMELLNPVTDPTAYELPVNLRSTGMAAREADARCLKRLSSNATTRAASMVLAGNSALGA